MAKFNLENYTAADGLGFPLNFRRGAANPLDNSSVWASFEEAKNYAQTDPVAYVGQVLTVVTDAGDVKTATAYVIDNEAGDLKEVGSSPVGDESTITVAEDGTISLFGVSGLTFEREGVAVNYQPLLVNGVLTWVEPSATTVEGLATEIEGIKSTIGTVPTGKTVVAMIAEAQEAATYDDTAVSDRIAAIENDYLKAADKAALEETITEEAAKAKTDAITAIMGEAGIDEKYDTLKEIADWILSDTKSSAELITRVTNIAEDYLKGADKTELQGEIDALEALVGQLPEGAASETVVAYVQEAVNALKIGDYAKATDLVTLADRVQVLEDAEAEKNVINSVDTAQFNVSEDGKLSLNAVPMDVVTGLSDSLDGKVDKVEGSRLITGDEATKLEKLVLGEDGTVSISGEINASNVKELGSWITTNRDDVPGLLSAVNSTKLDAIESGAQVNVIEAITIGDSALAVDSKTVNIPLATVSSDGALSAVDKAFIDSIKDTYATKTELATLEEKCAANEQALTWGEL